jgi:cytochrome c553
LLQLSYNLNGSSVSLDDGRFFIYRQIRAIMKLRTSLPRTLSALAVMASCALAGPALAADTASVGNATDALAKTSMCIGCHGIPGYKASFPEVYHVPMIAGQKAEYIVAALKEYANGARTFPSMEAIAKSLSPQDMADLAAYYSSFK